MKKDDYLDRIRQLLQGMPPEDLDRSLAFYAESIADRMEDGMSEAEAVASMESPEEVAKAILMEQPLAKLVKARAREKHPGALEIVLLILGAPLWLPLVLVVLLLALVAVLLLWVFALVFAAVTLALGLAAVAVMAGLFLSLTKLGLPGILVALSAALLLAGLAILMGFAVVGMGKLAVAAGKALVRGVKSLLIR